MKATKLMIFFAAMTMLMILITSCSINNNGVISDNKDDSLRKVEQRGQLIVGLDAPYGFMEYYDEKGNLVGLEIDIIKEVAKRMDLEPKIIDYDWDNLFDAIKSGEVDVSISGITITLERKEELLFSIPYFNSGQTIMVRKDYDLIKSPEDLADKKVGAQKETVSLEEAKKYTNLTNQYDEQGELMLSDLKSGKIDAIVLGDDAAVGILRENPDLKLATQPITQEFAGIATKIGNEALIEGVNSALREMKRDGTLSAIINKWMKV
jgi:polar amino acid transport system substrate-binding protein